MTKGRKVTLISRESDDITLDFKLLKEELESRGVEVEVLTKLLRKKFSLAAIEYLGHIFKQKKAIKNSQVVVVDTYCIPISMMKHPDNLEVIQMWHALSAIKKFGWQTVGKKDGTSPKIAKLMKMHQGYDHVICASDITADYFCEAFNIGKNKIVKLGLPRIDYIMRQDIEVVKTIHDRYPVLNNGKKNILYAPTFHKGNFVDLQGLADAINLDEYNLIVKLHPIDSASTEHIIMEGVIYDNEFSSYDMLRVADIVVSDYSSFVVEASLAEKPIYLYVYDRDNYDKSTGFNVDYDKEAIGKYAFENAEELAATMRKDYDYAALKEFRDKYIDIDTKDCTKKLADYIENLL